MADSSQEGEQQPAPHAAQVIGVAIQDMTAERLGRGFVPLALLLVVGVVQLFTMGPTAPAALTLTVGAPLTGVAMLAYGLRVVQRAFGRPPKGWMGLAMLGSLLPPTFALYVLGWRGLRALAGGGGVPGVLAALGFTLVGIWVMRSWMRVVEVERLSHVMGMDIEGGESE